jgi:hypothetical protein
MSKEAAAPAHRHSHPAAHAADAALAQSSSSNNAQLIHAATSAGTPYLLGPDEQTEYLITFNLPEEATAEERGLAADIVILDHRNKHKLKPKTPEWDEVSKLLINAVVFLQSHEVPQGRVILQEAQKVYYHHNQTRNRIRYLGGALSGILTGAALGAGLLLFAKSMEQVVARQMLILILIFAGIGSLTSVLTRVSSIDLREETSNFSVLVSGFSRPVVAMVLAVVVYLMVNGKIVDIKVGSASDPLAMYLVIAFLSGFSERFAQDIVARVPFAQNSNHVSRDR